MKPFLTVGLILLAFILPARGFNEEDAMDQWASAYIWLQNGRNHSAAGQDPLALGCFLEALKRLQVVADKYPSYETKMVNYRLEALKSDIAALTEKLNDEEKNIAREYITVIDMLELADDQRFAAQRKDALRTLRAASAALEAIISKRPDGFKPALRSQTYQLSQSIVWLSSQLEGTSGPAKGTTLVASNTTSSNSLSTTRFPISSPTSSTFPTAFSLSLSQAQMSGDGRLIRGTTEFVAENDLPSNPEESETVSLFPGR